MGLVIFFAALLATLRWALSRSSRAVPSDGREGAVGMATDRERVATVSVYRRGETAIVVPTWRGCQEVEPAATSDLEFIALKAAAEAALAISMALPDGIPPAPQPPAAWRAAGVASERQFNSDLALVTIRLSGGRWRVQEWGPDGRGFKAVAESQTGSLDESIHKALAIIVSCPAHPRRRQAQRRTRRRD